MQQRKSDLGRYAIGQQSFGVLREDDAVYVDKTMFAHKIINSSRKYFFLARPRRFGKSLFLSMLKCLYEGKRELFEGLYIDTTDWKWEQYPVLHLDLNIAKYDDEDDLSHVLDSLFEEWERQYGIERPATIHSVRFQQIIEAAHRATGKKVVILVDEYDKPLVNNLQKLEKFEHYRDKLAGIYSNFKSSADHIQLVFMTGVSRFSKLSVFSGLNNILDISFEDEYADICGITEKEMISYYPDSINALATAEEKDYDEMLSVLKSYYDGYRFSRYGSEIYNPWSLLTAFSSKMIGYYWTDTGIPTLLAESLKNVNVDLKPFLHSKCTLEELKGFDLYNPRPLAMLYQTGYLTIKDYDKRSNRYTLGVPNKEVEEDFLSVLLPFYADLKIYSANYIVWDYVDCLEEGRPGDFMKKLSDFFASIEYSLKMEDENNFHNAFYIVTRLLGLKVSTEVETSDGRIDLTIETDAYLYIIELKFDSTPQAAIKQIEEKQYASKFAGDSRKIYLIGASFNSKTRRIDSYEIKIAQSEI